jgi:hypothetical protein
MSKSTCYRGSSGHSWRTFHGSRMNCVLFHGWIDASTSVSYNLWSKRIYRGWFLVPIDLEHTLPFRFLITLVLFLIVVALSEDVLRFPLPYITITWHIFFWDWLLGGFLSNTPAPVWACSSPLLTRCWLLTPFLFPSQRSICHLVRLICW